MPFDRATQPGVDVKEQESMSKSIKLNVVGRECKPQSADNGNYSESFAEVG